jgi:hypothetical protein
MHGLNFKPINNKIYECSIQTSALYLGVTHITCTCCSSNIIAVNRFRNFRDFFNTRFEAESVVAHLNQLL